MGSTIVLNGSGAVTTDFMKVAGFPNINFNTSSTSAWGNVRMRVAMALDVTGSMRDDGKMPAMQTAAKSLIDQLSALAKSPGDIYISIVPFAKDVNMGASNYNAALDRLDRLGCRERHPHVHELEPVGQLHQFLLDAGQSQQWTGCLTDRDQNYDTRTRRRRPRTPRRCSLPRNTSPATKNTASRAMIPICSRSCR